MVFFRSAGAQSGINRILKEEKHRDVLLQINTTDGPSGSEAALSGRGGGFILSQKEKSEKERK